LDFKRLSIAFVLSAAVLILWPKLFPPPEAPKGPAVPAVAPKSAGSPGSQGSPAAPTAPVAAAAALPASAAAAKPAEAPRPAVAVEPVAAGEAKDVVVTTPLWVARLSNQGGDLVSWTLRKFKDGEGKDLDLVRKSAGFPGRTARLDASPSDPFLQRAAGALYQVTTETKGLEATVRFHYREATGEGIVRSWTFGPGYVVGMKVQREGSALPVAVFLGPGIGNPSEEDLKTSYTKPGATIVLKGGGSVDRRAKDGLKEAVPEGQGLVAAGLEDNYFLTAFLPRGAAAATLRPVKLQAGKEALDESEVVLSGVGLDTELFLGPKDLDLLEKLRPGMDKLIDYGWFAIVAKPLLWGLKWIQGFVVNWGVAIIVITFVIKVVLFPLTYKQLVSMKKMSTLQPRVETIRAKWSTKLKSDPQARVKMNEEMMGLYKTEGVNPAGGCLPLLLQMPILIAFYQMLAHAIELRHAPFWLWIQDLSAKDPYYVTPILMTATMWIQQQMTPSTGDATQKKIMAAMPLVFGFMFKDMPSGLVLYWLVQNVLTIGQQMLLNKYTDLGPVAAPKKA
jgi:YidC/Oxa1 family membrane protein insertase